MTTKNIMATKTLSKKVTLAALFILAAAAVTACSKGDNTENGDPMAVRFSAAIGQTAIPGSTPQSRASGTAWDANDAVGIFMLDNGTTDALESNKNYDITNTVTGALSPVSGNEIYYPMNGAEVDFIAYYPYQTGAALGTDINVTIETAQTTATQPGFDLMWAKADNSGNGYGKTGASSIPLEFEHKLSKLVMNCKADNSVNVSLANMTATITGMNTKSRFDLAIGQLTGTPSDKADITSREIAPESSFDASYDAIVMPCSYAAGDVKVVFMVGGEPFTWTLAATEFKPGYEHIYEVTLSRTLVTGTGTIKPWTTENQGPVTAE